MRKEFYTEMMRSSVQDTSLAQTTKRQSDTNVSQQVSEKHQKKLQI